MKRENTIVKISFDNFGSNGTIEYLNFLSHSTPIKNELGGRRNGMRGNRKITYKFNHTQDWAAKQFLSQLKNIFREGYLTIDVKTEPAFESDWGLFGYLLSTYDWSHEMSDDHRYWEAGIKQKGEMSYLAKKLYAENPSEYYKLVNQYEENAKQWFPRLLNPVS